MLLPVELYHATDETGAHGIMQEGFAVSHLPDSRKSAWFCSTRQSATTGSANREWLVMVDMPAEVAEQHRYRFGDGTVYLDNYLIPWDVVNIYRPFRCEPWRAE